MDEGYNANIYYSSDSDYFYVHPVTGVVYPTSEIFEFNQLTFTVRATDRNGTGLSTTTNITVCITIIPFASVLKFGNSLRVHIY